MGERALRRDFDLPEEDTTYLNVRGLGWETIRDANALWLIVRDLPIPEGYDHRTADAAVQIPPSYPTAGLDMVYFRPGLHRVDGIAIRATEHMHPICGEPFYRWSRHRTSANPWRPGEDGVCTHLGLIEEWLIREFARNPKR